MLSLPEIQLCISNYFICIFIFDSLASKKNPNEPNVIICPEFTWWPPKYSFGASFVVEHQLEIVYYPKFLKLVNFSWSVTMHHGFLKLPFRILLLCFPTTAVVYTCIPFPLNKAPSILSPSIMLCGTSLLSVTNTWLPEWDFNSALNF